MISSSAITASGARSPLDHASVPAVRAQTSSVHVEDRTFVYDERRHTMMVLNPTAAAIWSACDGTRTIEELAEDLAAAFGVDLDRVRFDLMATVAKLVELGLMKTMSRSPAR